jgi:hypothetical protein
MGMMGPLTTCPLRSTLAAGALLALLGTAPARAVTSTVYWDRADFGFGAGIGVSAATATGSGIPIVDVVREDLRPNTLPTTDTLSQGVVTPLSGGGVAVTQQWTAANNVGGLNDGGGANENQILYLVYAQPDASTLELDGQLHNVEYDPADVGLSITNGEGGADWVIFRTIATTGDTMYLPAVSLGTLAYGADPVHYSLSYRLQHPQVFQGDSIDKLGVPSWNLAFITRPAAPIPEPTSGLLMMMGLLAISHIRRKRS